MHPQSLAKLSKMSALFIGLCATLPFARPLLWRWLYNKLVQYDSGDGLLFMNYGYADQEYNQLALDKNDEPYRYPIQLYRRVLAPHDIKSKDVVEIGCGRGGGAVYLSKIYQPKSYTAVDLSPDAINWCRQRHQGSSVIWRQGSAQATGLEGACADLVLNVESSHCYPSFDAFLAEVVRLLRPDGMFAFCDLRVPSALPALNSAMLRHGLDQLSSAIISLQVVNALASISAQREAELIPRMPKHLQKAFREFVGVKDTAVYEKLKNGEMVYICNSYCKSAGGRLIGE